MKNGIQISALLFTLSILAGCANTPPLSTSQPASAPQPVGVVAPSSGNSDNTPVTLSGYVDTGTTVQVK